MIKLDKTIIETIEYYCAILEGYQSDDEDLQKIYLLGFYLFGENAYSKKTKDSCVNSHTICESVKFYLTFLNADLGSQLVKDFEKFYSGKNKHYPRI